LISGNKNSQPNSKSYEIKLDFAITYNDQTQNILGCPHYQRPFKKMCSQCNQLFTCRICHDEQVEDHKYNRFATEKMMCMNCNEIQPIAQECIKCQKKM